MEYSLTTFSMLLMYYMWKFNCYHFRLKNDNNFHTELQKNIGKPFCDQILEFYYFWKVLSGNFVFCLDLPRSKISLLYIMQCNLSNGDTQISTDTVQLLLANFLREVMKF